MSVRIGALGALLATGLLACQPTPMQPVVPREPEPTTSLESFSVERVWAHLEALASIGPRASGTPGAARARAYIADQLDAIGLEVEQQPFTVAFEGAELPDLEMVNLLVTIPGESDDLFVLATPYDTRYFGSFRFIGANAGGSSAALMLELARLIAKYPLPYTTRIAFLDGEATLGRGGEQDTNASHLGSSSLAAVWKAGGVLPGIRLLVYLDRVGDADLKIALDLLSFQKHREDFWDAAGELGYTEIFEPRADWESVAGGHEAFLQAGVRRVVAVVDTRFGGDEAPGLYANTEDDTLERCSPGSLEAVGRVTLLSLETIGAQLAKIDHFSDAPLRDLPDDEPPPEAVAAESPTAAGESPAEPPTPDVQETGIDPAAGDSTGRAWTR